MRSHLCCCFLGKTAHLQQRWGRASLSLQILTGGVEKVFDLLPRCCLQMQLLTKQRKQQLVLACSHHIEEAYGHNRSALPSNGNVQYHRARQVTIIMYTLPRHNMSLIVPMQCAELPRHACTTTVTIAFDVRFCLDTLLRQSEYINIRSTLSNSVWCAQTSCATHRHYGQRQQVGALAPSTGAAAAVTYHSDKMPVLRRAV